MVAKFVSGVWLIMVSLQVWGAANLPPATCNPIPIQGEAVTLHVKKPTLMLIHSLTKSKLWLTHPVADPGASAGWTSQLDADQWSAFRLDRASFEINCVESAPGHEQQIPCEGAIAICEWSAVKFNGKKQDGTYWVGENMDLNALFNQVKTRGFVLPTEATQ